jgi:phage terminase large subunit-like protein
MSFFPFAPSVKQQTFLNTRCPEVFFGGAAGGGKSVALLMAALQHIKEPGYAALIIRKDLPRLELAGGLIPKSHEWFACRDDAAWNGNRRQWSFATCGTPATITFGYLAGPLDKYRYASSEYQYIAFDELTDFAEDDYLFLFSRLRKVRSLRAPLRMRSASNPGGMGHLWVKQRFIDGARRVETPDRVLRNERRLYIPSRIADNPALDEAEYRQTLSHLPTLARERLMNGDWSVQAQGLFHAEWLRYYAEQAEQLELFDHEGRSLATVSEGSCRRFVTIDPAGTSAERTREAHGRGACWTVIQVWDRPPRELSRWLLLRHQHRARLGFDELCRAIVEVHRRWQPERLVIEQEKLGQAAIDALGKQLPLEPISTGGKDKVARAGPLMLMFERGEVFLPKHESTWRPGFEAELLAWTGTDREPSDQIDAAAYAAQIVATNSHEPILLAWDSVRS